MHFPFSLCVAALILLCIAGCASEPKPADALITRASHSEFGESAGCPDTVSMAAKAGVDYKKVVEGAMRRDRKSLHTLFWLTVNAGFDGASGEGHAAVMGNLLRYLGDATFGRALTSEPIATRHAVQDELRYDFGDVSDDLLKEWFPLTCNDVEFQ